MNSEHWQNLLPPNKCINKNMKWWLDINNEDHNIYHSLLYYLELNHVSAFIIYIDTINHKQYYRYFWWLNNDNSRYHCYHSTLYDIFIDNPFTDNTDITIFNNNYTIKKLFKSCEYIILFVRN
jgi:hypothetical protein